MAGTVSTPIFVQDGQYLTFVVATGAITLGEVVMLNNDGTVSTATQSSTAVVGVAITGNRVSRTATDDQVAVGDRVTVITRGVVNVTIGAGGVDEGQHIEVAAAAGTITTHSAGSTTYLQTFGKCLVGGAEHAIATVLIGQI